MSIVGAIALSSFRRSDSRGRDHRQVMELRADLPKHGRDGLGGDTAHHARDVAGERAVGLIDQHLRGDRCLPTGEPAGQDAVGDDRAEGHVAVRERPGQERASWLGAASSVVTTTNVVPRVDEHRSTSRARRDEARLHRLEQDEELGDVLQEP